MPVTAGPDDILARLRRLETRVDELTRGTLANAVISSGGITVRDLGGISLVDRDGETVFFVGGADGSWARPDGTPQPITSISDDRGRWRIAVFDPAPNERGYRQFVAVFDYSGNIILGDDADSGEGLARPYIPHTVSPARYSDWPATTASDWEALQRLRFNRQHSWLDADLHATTDNPDTTGEIRLRDPDGNTVLGTHPVAFQQALFNTRAPVPGTWGQKRDLVLEARRTTGTGAIRAAFAYAAGVQS